MERDALPGIPICIAVVVSWQYNCLLGDFFKLPVFVLACWRNRHLVNVCSTCDTTMAFNQCQI
jgi:hypothetical protein